MIDFSRAILTHFAIHHVGNKGLGEELVTSSEEITLTDDFVKDTVLRYFQMPFKTDIYHKFRGNLELNLHGVGNMVDDYFQKRGISFMSLSKKLANILYDQTMHPKLMGGNFCVTYFKDLIVDGELVDAIGLFKTEKRETFLKFNEGAEEFSVETDCGIATDKLDKGCLIYNTERQTGYKLSIIDTNNRKAETAMYWSGDFLNTELKPNSYYHTSNFIESVKSFCEEILPDTDKAEDADEILNKTVNYVDANDKISVDNYVREILQEKDLSEQFKEFRKDYKERLALQDVADEFEVSRTAVKENKKYMRTVLKLDKNFHVYIHGNHEMTEYGFDEERGLKFMKLYFVNKE